jgi:hypothetical protein
MIKILFDGWPIIYEENSPEALHLLSLLFHNPPEVKPAVVFPSSPPSWFLPVIETPQIEVVNRPTPNSPWKRLLWEQRVIPQVFREVRADLIHLTRPTVPLRGAADTVISPAGFPNERPTRAVRRTKRGIWQRLQEATAQAGLAQARAYFWPNDLPESSGFLPAKPVLLPPMPPARFPDLGGTAPQLPEAFILYHGPGDEGDLARVLSGWSWAAGSIGEYYPLLVLTQTEVEHQRLQTLAKEFKLTGSLRSLKGIPSWQLQKIYQKCSAVFHPTLVSPWGGPLRMGLANHVPIVAAEEAVTSAIVKKAAYLTKLDDARAMGAALITVIVEESVAEALSNEARAQTQDWNPSTFKKGLLEAYQYVLKAI